jgi:metal-responsive CopG/Arc/MetJ family transcriptional regulator
MYRTIVYNVNREVIKMDKKRTDMWLPVKLIEKVDEYKEEHGIPSRTAAIIELIRKGLDKK